MRKSLRRALIAAPVAAASLGLVLTVGAGTSAADMHATNVSETYSQGSVTYNAATDTIKVKDLKADGRTFAISVFGPAADGVNVCKVGGKGKSKTCDYNFDEGRLNALVFLERGNQHWDVDKFQFRA
ncbi:hypothetical protein SSOG_05119 [Streptomyces himastatinicus ATCC 53653]|uniref:Secreted protein n=1 Tax=Streptomyces himastatinicus ATCC 53653 TaxID=457427 RepID=D9WGL7_9ACTN|nr:hypothetical protein [Streptomyces himastatinicus]EFL25405.1 hypothetical protein SSOG_05119 [Streptomyces himastatinicus ATCC 53653]